MNKEKRPAKVMLVLVDKAQQKAKSTKGNQIVKSDRSKSEYFKWK